MFLFKVVEYIMDTLNYLITTLGFVLYNMFK